MIMSRKHTNAYLPLYQPVSFFNFLTLPHFLCTSVTICLYNVTVIIKPVEKKKDRQIKKHKHLCLFIKT